MWLPERATEKEVVPKTTKAWKSEKEVEEEVDTTEMAARGTSVTRTAPSLLR